MKNYLSRIFIQAAQKLDYLKEAIILFSVPAQSNHGDFATNVAMTLTKKLKRNPKEIAQEIIDNLDYDKTVLQKVELAGPGFINFYFTPEHTSQIVKVVLSNNVDFGKSKKYKGKRANVEFVSANPTGPLTVGHGRNAVIGDTIANMLEWVGYEVDREYYFNNAGRQMRILGDSVKKRYLELLGEKIEFPDDYYQGEYIKDIAANLLNEFGVKLADESEEGIFKERAEKIISDDISKTLESLKIKMKLYFNEFTLYDEGKIDEVLKYFEEKELSYKNEGATWLKLSELGIEQDKVIVKSTGEPTYRLPDIAYHKNKFEREYDLIVDIFGSDHAAAYPDVLAGLKAMDFDVEKIKVIIYQFVTIMEKGQVVKMSTRKANFITLEELIDEVGSDVVRYFFIMRNTSSHLNFDIDLAKKHSEENPVFYLQYAHARICSILNMASEENIESSTEHLELLNTDAEQKLLKKLTLFEEEILINTENFEPHKISNYLEELASLFHKFYTECRIIGSPLELAQARIALSIAVKTVLKNGLTILGLSAPERM